MGLFTLFHYSDSQLQRYKELEDQIVIVKAEAGKEFELFTTFQKNCQDRLRVIFLQLEKAKSLELVETREFIQKGYRSAWSKYLQKISSLRVSLQKTQEAQVSLLKHKSVRSYVSFKNEDQTELKKAINSLVLGYSANQIEREEFSKGFSRVLSLDIENPGIIDYFGVILEKAEKRALFQDFIDVIKEAIGKGKKKTKYADGIIFNDKGEILFLRRKPDAEFAPYEYGLPGGHVDFGENPQDAVKREISEECGVTVKTCELKERYEDDKVIIFYFQCTLQEPYEVVLTRDEHFNYEWLSHEVRQTKSLISNLNDNLNRIYGIEGKRDFEKAEVERVDDDILKPFTEEQIAKKYEITEEEAKIFLDEGKKVEKEHTKNKEVARTIASHHIYKESKDYYPELKKLEDKFKEDGIEKAMSDVLLSVEDSDDEEQIIEKAGRVFSKLTKNMTVNKKGFLQTVYRSHPNQSSVTNSNRMKVNQKVKTGGDSEMDVDTFVKKFGHRVHYTVKQHPETKKTYTYMGGEDKKGGVVREIQLKPFTLSHEFDEDTMEHLRSYADGKEISKEEGINHEKELKQMGFKLIREREQSEE